MLPPALAKNARMGQPPQLAVSCDIHNCRGRLLVGIVVGRTWLRVFEFAGQDKTESRVVFPFGNVFVGNLPVYPPPTTTASDAIDLKFSCSPSDARDAIQIGRGSGLQGGIADDLWFGWRRDLICEVNHFSFGPRLVRTDRVHPQGRSLACIRDDHAIAREFSLFHCRVSDGGSSYPGSLFIPERCSGIVKSILRRFRISTGNSKLAHAENYASFILAQRISHQPRLVPIYRELEVADNQYPHSK